MRDVARQAGVSVKTVSRVFNDDPHVLPETRQRVGDALAALNYTPNELARAFRDGRPAVIGVALPNLADPFFAAIAGGIEQVAAAHDMSILVISLRDEPQFEEERVESLLKRQLGALVMAPTGPDQGYLRRWTDKVPVVFVDRPPRGIETDCFVEDDAGGAEAATAHLIGLGHRRIGLAGDSVAVPTTANRLEGYKAALRKARIRYDTDLVQLGAANDAGARAAAARLAEASPPPTAVFSSDAQSTMHMVAALTGRRLALAAFGDFPMAAFLSPSLTVIDQDPEALGRLAAEQAVHRLNGGATDPVRRVTLPVRLLQRASSRPPEDLVELFPLAVPDGVGRVAWSSSTTA